jgi:uncharacterized membrane protein YheB (UPF0754 family)
MFYLYLMAAPILGALIGWLTNRIAIQMLFHPRQPRRFLGMRWQGLIPRRHEEIAEKTADLVVEELVSQHVLRSEIEKIDLTPMLDETITHLVWERLAPKLKGIPFLGGFVNDKLIAQLHTLACDELRKEAPKLRERIATMAESHLDLRPLIRDRILSFELEKLEAIVWHLAGKEFRQIEWLGAILGALIGATQAGLMWLTHV